MNAEIIGIKTPVLFKDVQDERAKSFAKELLALGIDVKFTTAAPDAGAAVSALEEALSRSEVVFAAGAADEENKALRDWIFEKFSVSGEQKISGRLEEQSKHTDTALPDGVRVFRREFDSAWAGAVQKDGRCVVLLPSDFESYFSFLYDYVYDYLIELSRLPAVSQTLKVIDMDPAVLKRKLGDILLSVNPSVSVYAGRYGHTIRVTARSETQLKATVLCNSVLSTVCESLGEAVYGRDDRPLTQHVAMLLKNKELSLTAACASTAALMGTYMSSLLPEKLNAGALDIAQNGVLDGTLSVPAEVLDSYAMNSAQTAAYAAIQARSKQNAALAAASTYPRPGQDFCYIALAEDKNIYLQKVTIPEGADASQTVPLHLLNLLRLYLEGSAGIVRGMVRSARILCGELGCLQFLEQPDPVEEEPSAAPVPQPAKKPEPRRPAEDPFKADELPIESQNGTQEEPPRKKSVLRRIREYLFPCRGDTTGEKVRKIIFLIALIVLLVAGGFLLSYFLGGESNRSLNNDLSNLYGNAVDVDDYPDDYQPQFRALYLRNRDIKGWISIDGTGISYPVVQTDNNDYYLKHDFDKKESKYGTIFIDSRVDVKKPSTNMVIYGHNMQDKQMFGDLEKYREASFYKDHPTVSFESVYQPGTYKIFSIFISDPNETSDLQFDYQNYIDLDDEHFTDFVDQARNRSLVSTGVDVQKGDTFITLSTCVYDFYDARLVVMARRVRPGESESVDTTKSEANYAPLMPDIWYRTYGGTKPDFKTTSIGGMTSEASEPETSSRPEETSRPQYEEPEYSRPEYSEPEESAAPPEESPEEPSEEPEPPAPETPSEPTEPSESQASGDEGGDGTQTAALPATHTAVAPLSTSAARAVRPAVNVSGTKNPAVSGISVRNTADTAPQTDVESPAAAAQHTALMQSLLAARLLSWSFAPNTASDTVPVANMSVQTASAAADAPVMTHTGTASLPSSLNLPLSSSLGQPRASSYTVKVNGSSADQDAYTVLCQVVGAEMDDSFHPEALKAQAVAAYTYIKYSNATGSYPYVPMRTPGPAVQAAVRSVLGQAMYIGGQYVYTPYFACSGGSTNAAVDVWGYETKQLQSVESEYDYLARDFEVTKVYSADEVKKRIQNRTGITLSGDPSGWIKVLDYTEGGYIGRMSICGKTTYYNNLLKKTTDITGRFFREDIFKGDSIDLRSAKFLIRYQNGQFYITTWGYGHGAGMSQWGANLYAIQDGWSYRQILNHYYQGVTIQ